MQFQVLIGCYAVPVSDWLLPRSLILTEWLVFQECMRTKPQMREINRPNLKQSCQVKCEHHRIQLYCPCEETCLAAVNTTKHPLCKRLFRTSWLHTKCTLTQTQTENCTLNVNVCTRTHTHTYKYTHTHSHLHCSVKIHQWQVNTGVKGWNFSTQIVCKCTHKCYALTPLFKAKLETFEVQQVASLSIGICNFKRFFFFFFYGLTACFRMERLSKREYGALIQEVLQGSVYLHQH